MYGIIIWKSLLSIEVKLNQIKYLKWNINCRVLLTVCHIIIYFYSMWRSVSNIRVLWTYLYISSTTFDFRWCRKHYSSLYDKKRFQNSFEMNNNSKKTETQWTMKTVKIWADIVTAPLVFMATPPNITKHFYWTIFIIKA